MTAKTTVWGFSGLLSAVITFSACTRIETEPALSLLHGGPGNRLRSTREDEKERCMRALTLQDQQIEAETLFESDFTRPADGCPEGWLAEGGAGISVRDGRLFMNAAEPKDPEHPYLTLWCVKPFEGDTVIEYVARAEEGSTQTNINFFVYGTMPDGTSILDSTDARTGEYGEYHQLNNYIFTYLNSKDDGGTEEKLRIRFRKDPGFNLLMEKWDKPLVRSKDYHFTVVIQGPRTRFYVDGLLIFDYEKDDHPHRKGHHAFRTWKTHMSAGLLRVSRILSTRDR